MYVYVYMYMYMCVRGLCIAVGERFTPAESFTSVLMRIIRMMRTPSVV